MHFSDIDYTNKKWTNLSYYTVQQRKTKPSVAYEKRSSLHFDEEIKSKKNSHLLSVKVGKS